jgi:hypothetical protein
MREDHRDGGGAALDGLELQDGWRPVERRVGKA